MQWVWQINQAATVRSIYRALGMEGRLEGLFLLGLSANFVNVAAPSGGLRGVAVNVWDAREHGLSSAKTTLAGVLSVWLNYLAIVAVVLLGLIVIFRRGGLSVSEVVASVVLMATAPGLASVLYIGYRSEADLERLLTGAARLVNRFLRPILGGEYLREAYARNFAQEAAEGLHSLRNGILPLLLPAALALSAKALVISILFLLFLAFRQPFSVGTLIAGYAIG